MTTKFREYAAQLEEDLETTEGETLVVSKAEMRQLLLVAKTMEKIVRHEPGTFAEGMRLNLNHLRACCDTSAERERLTQRAAVLRATIKTFEDQETDFTESDWDELDGAKAELADVLKDLEALPK